MKAINSDTGKGDSPALQGASIFRPGIPTFDAEEFREFMDKLDASEEEKIEYLQLLWRIAITFVDISFGINSTQQVLSSTREFNSKSEIDSTRESHLVECDSSQQKFKRAATDEAARKGES